MTNPVGGEGVILPSRYPGKILLFTYVAVAAAIAGRLRGRDNRGQPVRREGMGFA